MICKFSFLKEKHYLIAHPRVLYHTSLNKSRCSYSTVKGKKNRPSDDGYYKRDIRQVEDTHALRLKSKLFDLRAGYANPRLAMRAEFRHSYSAAKGKKNRPSDDGLFFFGWGIGIRTPTNRVRVCRAAVTQFPNAFNANYFITHSLVCQVLFVILLKIILNNREKRRPVDIYGASLLTFKCAAICIIKQQALQYPAFKQQNLT